MVARGACVIAPGGCMVAWGACVVAWGGMCGCSGGGMCGCSGGMHGLGGHVWLLGGCAWLLQGGHAWLLRGACMVFSVFSDTMRYGQSAGGTHPTGMHSCFDGVFSQKRQPLHGPMLLSRKEKTKAQKIG